jgi:hydrogenase-4 component B
MVISRSSMAVLVPRACNYIVLDSGVNLRRYTADYVEVRLIASILVFGAAGVLLVSALAAGVAGRLARAERANRATIALGSAGAVLAALLGLAGAGLGLFAGVRAEVILPWNTPLGQLRFGLDPLSSFFLLSLFIVFGLSGLYGAGYLRGYEKGRRVFPATVAFNVLGAAMTAVLLARDAVSFLLAWEGMSVASYVLVTFESERDSVRRAGVTYLIATHIGVLALMVLFALLASPSGSFAFADLVARGPRGAAATACFALALFGFGAKAGLWPMHFWLPDAHPAAPSHVSAVMSGVMIKLGVYGLLRVLGFLGPWRPLWGVSLVGGGVLSGVIGVLLALSQRDVKRLLAYCSIENVGLIAIGVGLGVLGQSLGHPRVATLGFAAALLHVLGHGLAKSVLFHGAGSVLHATGTRDLGSLGGLLRRMPVTGSAFLVGSAALAGLPPLGGFASEFVLYLAAFRGASELPRAAALVALLVLPALALTGGLAAVCFIKAFGIAFLGEPRTAAAGAAVESGRSLRLAMIVGGALGLAVGLWPVAALVLVAPAAAALVAPSPLGPLPAQALTMITQTAATVVALVLGLAWLRRALLARRQVAHGPTWGCGYAHPTPRMQYSATSFVDPIRAPFAQLLRARVIGDAPSGYFPRSAHYEDHVRDVAGDRVLAPLWRRYLRLNSRLRVIQSGRMQLYLAYVLVTLVGLLLWQLRGALGG